MVEEEDLAAKLQKVTRRDPVALSAEQALGWPRSEARARCTWRRRSDRSKSARKRTSSCSAWTLPMPSRSTTSLRLSVLKAEDVRTVIIGGRVVLQDRHVLTLDQAAIVSRAGAYANVVKKSLNLADCPL